VDSRAEFPSATPVLQTPGGDLAELQAAIVIYHRMRGTNATAKSVDHIFKAFMASKYITTSRPFYYHTAESRKSAKGLSSCMLNHPALPWVKIQDWPNFKYTTEILSKKATCHETTLRCCFIIFLVHTILNRSHILFCTDLSKAFAMVGKLAGIQTPVVLPQGAF
jgi:hypothetical protein